MMLCRSRALSVLMGLTASTVVVLGTSPAAEGVSRLPLSSPGGNTIVLDPPSPPQVYEDRAVHLTGHLTNGRSGRLVVLHERRDGGWHRVAETRTDAEGTYAFDLTPVDPGPVEVRTTHPVGHGHLTSETRTIRVLDRRVYLFSRTSYNTFTDIVMTGSTLPKQPSRHVIIQHLTNGRWVNGADGHTDASGDYAIGLRNNLPGRWTVRAYWPGIDPPDTEEYSRVHRFTVHAVVHPVVTGVTRKQLGGSYHSGCPVGPAELRNVALTFTTFGPFVGRGTIVVRDSIVAKVVATARVALAHHYPIRRMLPAAHYGGSDIKMMRNDDTSAFNCRTVTGDPTRLSPHSYGTAIDIDTVENPYMDIHGRWWPRNKGQQFRDRSHVHRGMLYTDSYVTRALTSRGFEWGGVWSHPDYQHFDPYSGKGPQEVPEMSGPLGAGALPPPSSLGPGWHRYADPGGPEVGWVGNGSFTHERSAREAAYGVLPLGCQQRPSIRVVTPRHALQGAYRSAAGAPGQAVVMQFADRTDASAYFRSLVHVLRACRAPDGPSGVSVSSRSVGTSWWVGTRTYAGHAVWRESDLLHGRRVTVVLGRV